MGQDMAYHSASSQAYGYSCCCCWHVGGIFYGDIGMIYAIVGKNALLYPTTDVIDTYVYRALTDLGNISMSAAVGFFQSLVGFVLVITANQLARKLSPDSALY